MRSRTSSTGEEGASGGGGTVLLVCLRPWQSSDSKLFGNVLPRGRLVVVLDEGVPVEEEARMDV